MFKERQNCEKPVKELFLETLQQRLRKNFYEISEKNPTEKCFSSQLHITCKTYYNLSLKTEKYQLDHSTSLM